MRSVSCAGSAASRRPTSRRPMWSGIRSSRTSWRLMTRRGGKPSDAVPPPGRLPLTLSLQFGDPTDRALVTRHRVMRWLRSTLERPAEITVRVVDTEEGRALNRDFRARDYATNVLTFDYQREPTVVADLVLCGPVLRREADEQAVALVDHYAHLVVHGALH